MKKVLSLMIICVFLVSSLSACTISQDEESSGWIVETVTIVDSSSSKNKEQTSLQKDNSSKTVNNVSSKENNSININSEEDVFNVSYCTDEMLKKSLMYKGDTTRLASKIKAALADKNSTTKIAYLGDSITEGAVVGLGNEHYGNRFAEAWRRNIGNNVSVSIKGYGATTSYLGVHIVDDVILRNKPDIIFIEYVNDPQGMDITLNSIDSLLRKCLSLDNKPAVILLKCHITVLRTHKPHTINPQKRMVYR